MGTGDLVIPVDLVAPDGASLTLRVSGELVRCEVPDVCSTERVMAVGIFGPVWRVELDSGAALTWTWLTSVRVDVDGASWTVRDGVPAAVGSFQDGGWRVSDGGTSVSHDGQLIPGSRHLAWADCDEKRPAAVFVPFLRSERLTPAIELGTERHARLDLEPCDIGDKLVPMLIFDYRTARENGQKRR